MNALIIPTSRCNLRCGHCLRSSYGDEELSLGDLKIFLDGFTRHNLGRTFVLTGGEPTMHSNVGGILEILRQHLFRGHAVSNGQRMDGLKCYVAYSDILTSVAISLEGHNEEINDKVRGKGSFQKAIYAIKFLRQNKMPVFLHIVLSKHNLDSVGRMFLLAEQFGVKNITFSTVMPCVNSRKNDLLVSQADLFYAYEKYLIERLKYPHIKTTFQKRHFEECDTMLWPVDRCTPIDPKGGQLVLMANGDVSFCCDLADFDFDESRYLKNNKEKEDHVLGNIKKYSFEKILKNREELRKRLINRRESDYVEGNLVGPRKFICENCKFYFYKKPDAV